jgi:hypothetical protein
MTDVTKILKLWEKELLDVQSILRYIHTYPDLLRALEIESLLLPEEVLKSQMQWVELYNKYEGLEQKFFQPHWVPIQRDELHYFIDVSNPNYPLLDYHFNSVEPYAYTRKNLFDSINDLLLLESNDEGLLVLLNNHRNSLINY